MKKKNLSSGVLLINLGTPQFPTKKYVRKYLKEFLSDKRIIDIAWIFRMFLLYCIILPFRSKKSAKLYKKIWTKEGSPLLLWSQKITSLLQKQLDENFSVKFCMRYGSPSIKDKIGEFYKERVSNLIIIPLFPQYAASTTGSVMEKVSNILNKNWQILPYRIVDPFFRNPLFIEAQKERLLNSLESFKPDFILFSYHGLPLRHLKKSKNNFSSQICLSNKNCCAEFTQNNHFCYKAQCFETTRLIAYACHLPNEKYMTTFQSRFGRGEWTTPDTQEILKTLINKGIKKLIVMCPGFVSDCLETLEEINIRLKESWIQLGGSDLVLIESLNDNQLWIQCLVDLVQNRSAKL